MQIEIFPTIPFEATGAAVTLLIARNTAISREKIH
jgi:hypothetical protein